jgi:anthranilate synthase component 1
MLLDKINEFKDKNFAYFCKFENGRENGMEKLFVSDHDPVNIYNGAIEYMNNDFTKTIPEGKKVPIMVSYDFIDDIFPDIKLKRSLWPQISYIIPDIEFSEAYKRGGEKTNQGKGRLEDMELENKIGNAIERIRRGDLLQIVLSRRFDLEEYDPLYILKKFLVNDRSLYVYYYKFGDLEIIGSSPENLLSVQKDIITIYPVAGTRRRGKSQKEDNALENDLINDEKELLEHRMLVDLSRNDLGKVCNPGTVNVISSMEVKKFASVMHIVSTVSGKLSNFNLGDILSAVFPAGTVSGAPKKKAITLINEYENLPRGPYAGALGIAGNGEMDLALLIRSLFRSKSENYTQAGAGIVKDSVPNREVSEMYSKILTVTGDLYEKNIDY